MKKFRFLCITPYAGMYNLMNNIAQQRNDVELIIHLGNLSDGLEIVLDKRFDNIDAVISRAGTAAIIRQHTDLLSCDIPISVYDVLRTIRLAQSTAEEFAVVGFPDITDPADILRDIMQYAFHVIPIHSQEECRAQIQSLKDQGIRTIVGDVISVTVAQELGLQGLLIVSGLESIEDAINNAVRLCSLSSQNNHRAKLLSTLLEDRNEETVIYTTHAEEYYATTHDLPAPLLQTMVQRIPNVISQESLNFTRRCDNQLFSVKGRLLQLDGEEYCAYTVAQLTNSPLFERHVIQYLSAEEDLPDCYPIDYYLSGGEKISAIRDACERYARMTAPVLLMGAYGTGKDCFAHYIHLKGSLKYSSFVMIDVGYLDDPAWSFLLEHNDSPLMDAKISIYFKRMELATPEQRRRLLIFLRDSYTSQANRLFFSYTWPQGADIHDELYLYLTETMNCLQLQLPSLNQRREDIPVLISLYINAINIQYGTRVVGMTQGAILLLQNHSWTRNVNELFHVVTTLMVETKSSFISEEQVMHLLEREKRELSVSQENSIDLSRTLDEITKDIVQRVYRIENMNQTRTAKHLGISRSTLWRMLK